MRILLLGLCVIIGLYWLRFPTVILFVDTAFVYWNVAVHIATHLHDQYPIGMIIIPCLLFILWAW